MRRLPGLIANASLILVTSLWTLWGIAELYHEGWWGAWYYPLPYLIPGTVCLVLTLVGLRWPRVGGWFVLIVGSLFTLWWWGMAWRRGLLTWQRVLAQFPVSGSLVIIGVLLLLEGKYRGESPLPRGWYVAAVGMPMAAVVGTSAVMLPLVLTRVDDGDRGARRIEGNGVTLIWAPQGPGWNWRQSWGGYPSWDAIALYGVPPVGLGPKPGHEGRHATAEEMARYNLCRYLSEDGLTLRESPQDIWRMPTVEEYVRSLVRHGENAGCVWAGEFRRRVHCAVRPDKESPLWATDQPAIYYWAAEERDADDAYFVSYNGMVNAARKDGGNPRHSYRCVREP